LPDLNIGGQAVIEGVMMRSKDRISTAVRLNNGEILVKNEPYRSLTTKFKVLGWPIIRGAVSFVEMLIIGIRTLNFSADIAVKEVERQEAAAKGVTYEEKKAKSNGIYLAGSALVALGAGIFFFFFLPLWLAGLFGVSKEAVSFNLMAGAIRLTMFVAYVWAISFFSEFKRIFQYHGAEHKSIYAYEMGDELTPERAACHTRFHPRCGTSFILIVALFAILLYGLSDSLYAYITGHAPALLTRFAVHFSLLPLVAGGSFELLKLSGRTRENAVTRFLIQPGLWLQRITTKEPSADQLEVAIAALEASLGVSTSRITSKVTALS
jgi:uncharacterized protein YqhQ